jgi:heme ABC exporter ATP-binding subunit CcmA
MDRTIAIHATRLSKAFGSRTVLSRVDLEVAEGEAVALCGANGAGKTTLLRCLASVTRPSAGEVFWFGRPAAGCASARRLIGMVGHEASAYPHLTVRENVIFAARMYDVPHAVQRADDLIRAIGLQSHAECLTARISRGKRQRLALARALVHEPSILLLDEPFSGLDAEGTQWLIALLESLRDRGRTICFATHDRQLAERQADRIVLLQGGRLQEIGSGAAGTGSDDLSAARAA